MGALAKLRAAGVTHLTIDSRCVAPHCAFVALPPATADSRDGRDFVSQALAAGSPLVCGEGEPPEGVRAAQWVGLDDVRRGYPPLAAALAGETVTNLRVIGVTGTDGKTSVTWLASELFNALEPGACARLGTLGVQWHGVDEQPGFTTPPAAVLHPLLARMADAGQRRLVMEVSSHAIALGRVCGVEFCAGLLTTLARDHLDFHGDLESYHRIKLEWLDGLASDSAVVAPRRLIGRLKGAATRFAIGVGGLELHAGERRNGWTEFTLSYQGKSAEGRTVLIGELMLGNLALACGLALHEGFSLAQIAEAAAQIEPVPGRFEPIGTNCLVDYAHTPDALAQALAALRSQTDGRLIVVFGAGGDRDRGKRPEMAQAVEAVADLAIVTTDNPRHEDPRRIIADVVRGFKGAEWVAAELGRAAKGWARLLDRRAALACALALCGENDLLLVAGKGAETVQQIDGEQLPFDDRVELRTLMGVSQC